MKIWYKAVCDEHKEMTDILVSNPSCGAHYLGDKDIEIQAWLSLHYGCKLRLIHLDSDLDTCFESKYADPLSDIPSFRNPS